MKRITLEIVMDMHIFSTPKYKKWFGMISTEVCICALLMPELFDGTFSHPAFNKMLKISELSV
jgi:hypothetical protein